MKTQVYAYLDNEFPCIGFDESIVEFNKDIYARVEEYDNCELVSKGAAYDIIVCWNDNTPNDRAVYFGAWNDGPDFE